MGLELTPLLMRGKPVSHLVRAAFADLPSVESIRIILGICKKSPGSHWAKVLVRWEENWDVAWDWSHHCHEHHIMAWSNWAKDFGDGERTVRLSFSRCKLTPEHTLVVHVELEGRVYDALKKQTNVELPSREALGLGVDAVGSRELSLPVGRPVPGTLHRP